MDVFLIRSGKMINLLVLEEPTKTFTSLDTHTGFENDVCYLAEKEKSINVIRGKTVSLDSVGNLYVESDTKVFIHPLSTLIVNRSGFYSSNLYLLETRGFISTRYKTALDIISNRIKFKDFLKYCDFPYLPYTVNIVEKYPKVCKKYDSDGGEHNYLCKNKEDFNFFYKDLYATKDFIAERYLKQDIQCSYRVYMCFSIPCLIFLRVSPHDEFTTKLRNGGIYVPLGHYAKPVNKLVKKEKREKDKIYSDIQYVELNDREMNQVLDCFTQEKIEYNKDGIPIVPFLEELADLSTLLSLDSHVGECVIDILRDKTGHYYILDLSTDIEEDLISRIIGYDKYSRLIWDSLRDAGIAGTINLDRCYGKASVSELLELNYEYIQSKNSLEINKDNEEDKEKEELD